MRFTKNIRTYNISVKKIQDFLSPTQNSKILTQLFMTRGNSCLRTQNIKYLFKELYHKWASSLIMYNKPFE